jgi:hypothetical protein
MVLGHDPLARELRQVLCIKGQRIVAKDHTISFEGLLLQIPPSKHFRSIAGRTVDVLQHRDGAIEILYRGLAAARFSPAAVTRLLGEQPHAQTDLRAA